MRTRVYAMGLRFHDGLQGATENMPLVMAQFQAAHDYRKELVAIERARRDAVRALDAVPEVLALLERLAGVKDRKDRKPLLKELFEARKRAREGAMTDEVDEEGAPKTALAVLAEREHALLLGARALTSVYWGTYITLEAAAQAARRAPLYEDDGVTPRNPSFPRWVGDPRWNYRLGTGQLRVQLQVPKTTADVMRGESNFVRWDGRELALRIGTEGNKPIWARWSTVAKDRPIPDNARWRWVAVSYRKEGPWFRWSIEVTVDLPGEHPREMDAALAGAVAVEAEWYKPGDVLRVASWKDSEGKSAIVTLPDSIVYRLKKASDIKSIRDTLRDRFAEQWCKALFPIDGPWTDPRKHKEAPPLWLMNAIAGIDAWYHAHRSRRPIPDRARRWANPRAYVDLADLWRREKYDGYRPAYEALQTYELRENHLYEYESGCRRKALRHRKDFYRCLAARLAQTHRDLILDNRDLSKEARWGDESDLRFAAAPSELRMCLKHAFGRDVGTHTYKQTEKEKEEDDRPWTERALEAWEAGEARGTRTTEETTRYGAWSKRKSKKASASTAPEEASSTAVE